MRFRLCYDVRLLNVMAFESEFVAGIGIGADGGDARDGGLDLSVKRHGRFDASVAYFKRNNATLFPRISSPDDGALPFF